MINKQIILEHCQQFFQYRLNHKDGLCNPGWGNQDSSGWSERCALGALVPAKCRSIREAVLELLGKNDFAYNIEFYEQIMRFNDHHSIERLTEAKIDDFLGMLAGKYGLDYEPINADIRLKTQCADKEIIG